MNFVIIAHDHADALGRRLAARSDHLAGLERGKSDGWMLDGAAILNDDGEMAGSVMFVDFPDRAALDDYLAAEPYLRENVWDSVAVHAIRRLPR